MRVFKSVAVLVIVGGVCVIACSGGVRTQYTCGDLTKKAINPSQSLSIWERGDKYIRLEDDTGKKLYECFCSLDSMKSAAAKICEEGAVCRKAGAPCSTSGDCCAGLFCTVNTCG